MLENKKLNMVFSLLIAIALWAFVIGEVNPEATRSYRDVPIQFVNEAVLTQSGMAVYSVSDRTLNVTLTGTRSEINKVDTKDIRATVDLNDAVMGENQLRISLRIPNKVEIESQSANKVVVTVEERIFKEVPVEVSYEGEFTGEEEPITVELDPDTVSVSGAKTTVGSVTAARANVAENSITADPKEFQCNLIAVNSAGQRVYNVELSQTSAMITSELVKLKTVPLHVPIKGNDDAGIERKVTLPEEITIKGKAADLDTIDSVTAETIYLNDIMASTNIRIEPILPEDVEVSEESSDLRAVVQVTKLGTKTMRFTQDDIEIRGLAEGMHAELEDSDIDLTITGNESLVENLKETDFAIFADLTNLKAGRHKVILQATADTNDITIHLRPKKITVTVQVNHDESVNSEDNDEVDVNANNNNDEE